MGILSSLFSGISGLDVHGNAMSVVGNNIANLNTIGFKGSRVEFADALSQSIGGALGTSQIGRGVQLSSVSPGFIQGSFETTNRPTDLALDGEGFFLARDSSSGGTFYTRAGEFFFNVDSYLINPNGLFLQGWAIDSSGVRGALGDINVSVVSSQPQATTSGTGSNRGVEMAVNLDADSVPPATAGYTQSTADVTDSFRIVLGTNDDIIFEETNGTDITATIAPGTYTGSTLAAAIETALEVLGVSDYTVSYNATTDRFTITSDGSGGGGILDIEWDNAGSTAAATLGFSAAAEDTGALSYSGDTAVAFNIISGTGATDNDTFGITVNGTGASLAITVPAGVYTGVTLAAAIQTAINADTNFNPTPDDIPDVTVDYGVTRTDRFTITSGQFGRTITGATPVTSSIDVTAGANDLLAAVGMTSDTPVDSTNTFDITNPASTSNFSTSLSIFDSLGNSHTLTIYFRKIAAGSWEWFGTVDGGEITPGQLDALNNPQVSGTAWVGSYGTLNFGTNGTLTDDITTTSGFDFAGATQNQIIGFDFGTGTSEATGASGTGLDGTTQFAGVSTVISQSQDGYGAGSLRSVSVGSDGIIVGSFSNGQTQNIAQVALATFASDQGLSAVGRNLFAETSVSGQPIIGQANTSGFGSITSNSLELSNVDLATEFVNMIKYQQGFMANSRVISTTDRLLTELVNLGR